MISVFTCLVVLARIVLAEVCSPSQCLSGAFNTTLGASFSSVILLPGTYSSTSPAAKLVSGSPSTPSGIATPNTLSFPYTVSLSSGALAFGSTNYGGESTLVDLSSNLSSPRLPASLAIPPNTAVTFRSSSSSIVLFASSPDTAQLPALAPDLAFSSVQSTSCSPACASGGACTGNGTCACATGFSGSQCEQCAPGFFGSTCQKCEDPSCCDDGMTGSGKCLGAKTKTPLDTCACQRGVCGSDGSCTCNPGWANPTSGQNSTKCSVCAPGFFQDPSGECQVCSQGCTACATSTGVCTTCQSGFSPDTNDRTRCVPTTSNSATTCPEGQFLDSASQACAACSPLCKTCTGPLSTQCIVCGAGQFMGPAGRCVAVDSGGVCQGTKLVANNPKGICDACPSTCTSCSIPSFSIVSTPSQITCSACLPGFVLTPSKRCDRTCPAGSFVSSSDGFTCVPCDASCSECTGSSTFCTACSGNRGAIDGKCVGTCPSGTVLAQSASTNSTGTTCVNCHADCSTCSGPGSTQCLTCPPERPVKSGEGRCLPTLSCGASSYFDSSAGTCQACDPTCASCVGSGGGMCSACSPGKVLKSGQCVDSGCGETYLGLCLSTLVTSPTSPKSGLSPLQIALICTSVLALLVLGLLLWRRQARKRRAARTAAFADTLPDDDNVKWEWGRVWRMRAEEGWFSGLRLLTRGIKANRRRRFHREMSLRKLGGEGSGSGSGRFSGEDERWRALRPSRPARERDENFSRRGGDSFVFDRPVVPGTAQTWWRDSQSGSDNGAGGVYGGINPESHFARTLRARSPAISKRDSGELEPDLTGASAHTFGVAPTIGRGLSVRSKRDEGITPQATGLASRPIGLTPQPIGLSSQPTGLSSQPTGLSSQPTGLAFQPTGSDIRAGNWMLPNHTGMESVSTHMTGSVAAQPTGTGLSAQQAPLIPITTQPTGASSVASHYTGNSSVVFNHTGTSSSSLAPHPTGASILVPSRGPLVYAPFLESSIPQPQPQPRQPLKDGTGNPFARSNTDLLMSPPPQGVPSSPVWPGAIGGSYWFSETQREAAATQPKMGDKNPFRRF